MSDIHEMHIMDDADTSKLALNIGFGRLDTLLF